MIKVIEKSRVSVDMDWQIDTFECEKLSDWVKKYNLPFYNQTDDEWVETTKQCIEEQMSLPENERKYLILEPENWYDLYQLEKETKNET